MYILTWTASFTMCSANVGNNNIHNHNVHTFYSRQQSAHNYYDRKRAHVILCMHCKIKAHILVNHSIAECAKYKCTWITGMTHE